MIYRFIIGSCWGSFLAHLGYCLSQNEKIKFRRSHCDFCLHKLNILDLVPIFSFVLLRGRCRYCGQRIKVAYFVMEVITGIIFTQLKYGSVNEALLFVLISVLLVIAYVDYETLLIADWLLATVLGVVLIDLLSNERGSWLSLCLGVLTVSGTMALLNRIKQDCFGEGDIKLMAIMGMFLGFEKTMSAALIATLSAGLIAVILKFLFKSPRKYLPFAPFLVLGIIINILR